jgi:hypothetical protein
VVWILVPVANLKTGWHILAFWAFKEEYGGGALSEIWLGLLVPIEVSIDNNIGELL